MGGVEYVELFLSLQMFVSAIGPYVFMNWPPLEVGFYPATESYMFRFRRDGPRSLRNIFLGHKTGEIKKKNI